MTSNPYMWAWWSFISASILAFTIHFICYSPITPHPFQIPTSILQIPTNNHLKRVIKIGEGLLEKPEDVCVGDNGVLYTATRDGWVKRLNKNDGSWENWKFIGGHGLLGIAKMSTGDVLVCDAEKGLFKVGENGVTLLASQVNGTNISFVDDVIEASDGSVYFSVASTKFALHEYYLDMLEAKPHGQLLKYDSLLQETSILLHDLGFANGVALSKDQDYLVVCETWKFRCLKYWLKGKSKGETEIFVDNLPGGPDNINLAPDGTFWIALVQLTSKRFQFVYTLNVARRFLASFPKVMSFVNEATKRATVVNVATDGRIIRRFDDVDGSVMSFVTSALEFEDHLYLGSLNTNFVGKLSLRDL